jgi:hypothetical protein
MIPRPVLAVVLASVAVSACAKPEDPARVELRARIKQEATLSPQDLSRMMDEVAHTLDGKKVQATRDSMTSDLDQEQRDVVFGMLSNREGVFDEGLRTTSGSALRIINAPGLSLHPEYSAARRLFIDVETFVPRRFEFAYEFPGMGDYALDLNVQE